MAENIVNKLKVTELKGELKKRKLKTHGNKSVLHSRLMEVLQNEGHDTETFVFDQMFLYHGLQVTLSTL